MNSSTKRRLDEIRSFIAESENYWKTKAQKDQVLQYVTDLAYLCQPKKETKLKKRLNKLEASVNCLVHHLVEKPLIEKSKINAEIEEKQETIFRTFDSLLPNSILINQWVDFRIIREYFPDFSFVKTQDNLQLYCNKKGHKIEFQKKSIVTENNKKEARLHFMITT